MKRVEAYHILHDMWKEANEEQQEAIEIAQNDIEFVDLMPKHVLAQFSGHMTNADHIRSMSDDELAEFLTDYKSEVSRGLGVYYSDTSLYKEAALNYLKQPYKENG